MEQCRASEKQMQREAVSGHVASSAALAGDAARCQSWLLVGTREGGAALWQG